MGKKMFQLPPAKVDEEIYMFCLDLAFKKDRSISWIIREAINKMKSEIEKTGNINSFFES